MNKDDIFKSIDAGISSPARSSEITELLQFHIDLVSGAHCPPHNSTTPHISICSGGKHDSKIPKGNVVMEIMSD